MPAKTPAELNNDRFISLCLESPNLIDMRSYLILIEQSLTRGEVTWADLNFTQEDLNNALKPARELRIKQNFALLFTSDPDRVESLIKEMYELQQLIDVTWPELGIHEPKLQELLHQAQVKIIQKMLKGLFSINDGSDFYEVWRKVRLYTDANISEEEIGATDAALEAFFSLAFSSIARRMYEQIFVSTNLPEIEKIIDFLRVAQSRSEISFATLFISEEEIEARLEELRKRLYRIERSS